MTDPGIRRGSVAIMLIALASAGLLGMLHQATAGRIAANESAELRSRIQALADGALPEPFPDVSASTGRWSLCRDLVLVRAVVAGYGGPMQVSYTLAYPAGSDPAGRDRQTLRIGRVRILNHQETPGITSFLDTPESGWLASLGGQSALTLAGLDAVTGATITSRALLGHLRAALAEDPAAPPPPATDQCP